MVTGEFGMVDAEDDEYFLGYHLSMGPAVAFSYDDVLVKFSNLAVDRLASDSD